MKAKYLLLFLLTVVVLAAAWVGYTKYFNSAYKYAKPAQAAFVISFDDQYVAEWYAQRALFAKYNVEATFFITNPDSLTSDEVEMLKALERDGHEIASHGAKHVNALNYTEEHGLEAYIQNEIIPSVKSLQKLGFTPVTFAYPYGANSRTIDHELLKYFYLLRGDSWKVKGKTVDELDKIFYRYDGRRVINGLGIDHGSGVTLEDIEQAFKRAAEHKQAIKLYAHAINNSKATYSISPEMLEKIFKAAQKYQLTSVTFKGLIL
ncbi:polysaccharide deacetylase family protein [Pontibacter burrus]|uniref:Polysaccharide deacetylase family protein n=1 Tax=Pontibacter burrus TaxID=2704466 RepID=A0A6B3LY78_9BACT|nr:polysaccharide deacetylase family protein [Pontibacter burrus]NEM98620.1 polysaccharide deacetylase family protein [Pontibacter burrus]